MEESEEARYLRSRWSESDLGERYLNKWIAVKERTIVADALTLAEVVEMARLAAPIGKEALLAFVEFERRL